MVLINDLFIVFNIPESEIKIKLKVKELKFCLSRYIVVRVFISASAFLRVS
jgi:hypothetical protein